MTILAVESVEKSFSGFKAVDDVTFSVSAGEVVAMIGPNGAGKTTTFNIVNGQLQPDRGRVLLDGKDVTGLAPRMLWRLGVGRTFQISATFGSMTVAENVLVALLSREHQRGFFARAAERHRSEIDALLSEVGMRAAADQLCGALSYGDVKRVELAMALANKPRLLLMDEPTAGMEAAERGRLMALVTGAARARGAAVLFTEHDMDVVFGHAQRIIVMNRGRIIASSAPSDIRSNPEVRRIYLGLEPVDRAS